MVPETLIANKRIRYAHQIPTGARGLKIQQSRASKVPEQTKIENALMHATVINRVAMRTQRK